MGSGPLAIVENGRGLKGKQTLTGNAEMFFGILQFVS